MHTGFDEQRKELIVGVIDYIQIYNNAKKAEYRSKAAMEALIGKGLLPTIIEPVAYKVPAQYTRVHREPAHRPSLCRMSHVAHIICDVLWQMRFLEAMGVPLPRDHDQSSTSSGRQDREQREGAGGTSAERCVNRLTLSYDGCCIGICSTL
jgi:hypothetical protein